MQFGSGVLTIWGPARMALALGRMLYAPGGRALVNQPRLHVTAHLFNLFLPQYMAISTAPRLAHQDVLDALARCVAACEYCATACLGEDDIAMMVPCIRLDRDCADICRLTAASPPPSSPADPTTLRTCSKSALKFARSATTNAPSTSTSIARNAPPPAKPAWKPANCTNSL